MKIIVVWLSHTDKMFSKNYYSTLTFHKMRILIQYILLITKKLYLNNIKVFFLPFLGNTTTLLNNLSTYRCHTSLTNVTISQYCFHKFTSFAQDFSYILSYFNSFVLFVSIFKDILFGQWNATQKSTSLSYILAY